MTTNCPLVCAVLGFGLLLACDSNDCEAAPLTRACEESFGCPKHKDAAVVAACDNPQGFGYWEEHRNGCGGWTVSSTGLVSFEFDFDAAGKLIGVTRWDDQPDQCDSVYGTPCKQPGDSFTTMECPASTDGGEPES